MGVSYATIFLLNGVNSLKRAHWKWKGSLRALENV